MRAEISNSTSRAGLASQRDRAPLIPLVRLLARQGAREVLAAGNRGGRDSEASRAPTESVVRPPGTPKFKEETGA